MFILLYVILVGRRRLVTRGTDQGEGVGGVGRLAGGARRRRRAVRVPPAE